MQNCGSHAKFQTPRPSWPVQWSANLLFFLLWKRLSFAHPFTPSLIRVNPTLFLMVWNYFISSNLCSQLLTRFSSPVLISNGRGVIYPARYQKLQMAENSNFVGMIFHMILNHISNFKSILWRQCPWWAAVKKLWIFTKIRFSSFSISRTNNFDCGRNFSIFSVALESSWQALKVRQFIEFVTTNKFLSFSNFNFP